MLYYKLHGKDNTQSLRSRRTVKQLKKCVKNKKDNNSHFEGHDYDVRVPNKCMGYTTRVKRTGERI